MIKDNFLLGRVKIVGILVLIPTVILLVRPLVGMAEVRDIKTNDDNMTSIYFKMGRSTILSFEEKPKSIVIGNKNYFNLEYIENDVTIQPLGEISTNLFVYTQNQTFGFVLIPTKESAYDDMVKVNKNMSFRTPINRILETSQQNDIIPTQKAKGPLIKFLKASFVQRFDFVLLDYEITNRDQKSLPIEKVSIEVSTKDSKIKKISIMFNGNVIKPNEKMPVRIIFRKKKDTNFITHIYFKDSNKGTNGQKNP